MTSAEDHRVHEEDLAAYLLDAQSPGEAREFRAHLERCPRCQADERWLRAAVEVLPSSVDQLEPPPELRRRLVTTVRGEAAAERKARPAPSRRRLLLRPAAGLAAVAVIAAGVGGYLIGDETGTTTTTIEAQATPAEPTARATVVRAGEAAVLRIARLPVQRRGRVYQIWLMRGKQVEPSSLFAVHEDGSGAAAIAGDLKGVRAVMVSEEPEGGSRSPTTEPVLVARL